MNSSKVISMIVDDKLLCEYAQKKFTKNTSRVIIKAFFRRLFEISLDADLVKKMIDSPLGEYIGKQFAQYDVIGPCDFVVSNYVCDIIDRQSGYEFACIFEGASLKAVKVYQEKYGKTFDEKTCVYIKLPRMFYDNKFRVGAQHQMMSEASVEQLHEKIEYLLDQLRTANIPQAKIAEIFNRFGDSYYYDIIAGKTALQLAAFYQYGGIVKTLLTIPGINLAGALEVCASSGGMLPRGSFKYDVEIPRALIRSGAVSNETIYQTALVNGHPDPEVFKPFVAVCTPVPVTIPAVVQTVSVPPQEVMTECQEIYIGMCSLNGTSYRLELTGKTPNGRGIANVTAMSTKGITQRHYVRVTLADAAVTFTEEDGVVVTLNKAADQAHGVQAHGVQAHGLKVPKLVKRI